MFKIVISTHILISFFSVLFIGFYFLMILKKKHTKKHTVVLVVSGFSTIFSGGVLLTIGSSISRVCVAVGLYTVILAIALFFGDKSGYESECPYLNGQM